MEISQHLPLKSLVTVNSPGDSKDIKDEFRKAVEIGSKMPLPMLKGLLAMKAHSFYEEQEQLTDEQSAILKAMIGDLDIRFLRWAAIAAANWDRHEPPRFKQPTLSIHGEFNTIMKRPKQIETELLSGGRHLLPLTHPEELSSNLEQFWKNLPDS